MITFVPHSHQFGPSPTEIKNAVKDAYYEIQQEEAERKHRELIEKQIQAEIDRNNDWFDTVVGSALVNGEEIEF